MDTAFLLLYLAPTLLMVLTACPLPYVLLVAAINILGGWTIIGWFMALWIACDAVKLRGPLGIVKFVTWITVSLLNRRAAVLPPPDRHEPPR